MQINWTAVAQGITTGVAGAIVFWIFGMLRDGIRGLWLRWSIKRLLRHTSCGSGIQGITTSVENLLQKSFTVREVCLVTDQANFVFNATAQIDAVLPREFRKLTKEQMAKLKRGEQVQVSTYIALGKPLEAPSHAGFVEVRPYTKRGFILPAELMADFIGNPLHLKITVEYETWTKKTRVVEQTTKGWAVEHMKKVITAFVSELESGDLDKKRAMFRLPPALRRAPRFPRPELPKPE